MTMSHRAYRVTLTAVLCIVLRGCHGGAVGPETVEVTGEVTFMGEPLEGANVIFHPEDGSDQTVASQAVTDASGRFELSTHVGAGKFEPGVVPGQYAVAVTKLDTSSISTTLAPPKNLLPKKYGNPKASGLTAKVAPGLENHFELALTDE
jgi:hypothetical protein